MELRRTDGPMQKEEKDVTRNEVDKVHKILTTVRDLVDTDNLTVHTRMRSCRMCRGKND